MTREERDLQALSFAYGNLACTTNHRPLRSAFRAICVGPNTRMKWTQEQFDAWANAREWREEPAEGSDDDGSS
jgi:hypothetical protein